MNQINLKNRTAIVTGGAQGFGLAITERFLESGANVIMWDIDEDTSGKVLKEKNNPKLSAAKIDVAHTRLAKNNTFFIVTPYKNNRRII